MNEDIEHLIIKAQQSLAASKLLLEGGYPDFAVARAYYTMFYLASAFLASKNLGFSKHSAVISAFGREFAKTDLVPRKYHQYLKQAQDLRHLGDYGDINIIEASQVKIQIAKAEEFFNFANDYLKK
jgi:uncharacterized protein (UPF0332 family)